MPHRFDPDPEDRAARFQRELDRTVLARDANPVGGADERRGPFNGSLKTYLACSICHRSLEAVPDCPACGDHEDMAA